FWSVLGAGALALLALMSALAPTISAQPRRGADETPVGRSFTRLADGRWLLLGGRTASGSVSNASLFDPATQSVVELTAGLVEARAWHSATLLATGQVLIAGGLGTN